MRQKVERLDRWLYFLLCGFALSLFTSVAGSSIFLGLSIALFLVRACLRRDDLLEPFKPYRRLVFAYGLFVLAMLVSALFSGDIRHGVGLVVSRQGYYVTPCVILMAIVRDRSKLLLLAKLALVSLVANNLCLYWRAWRLLSPNMIRIDGFIGYMALAAVFSVAIPLLYLAASECKGKWRWICLASCLSCVAASLLTGTRSGWLTSAAVLLLVAFLYGKNQWKLFFGALLVTACLTGAFQTSPQLAARFATMGRLAGDLSVTDRFKMWQSAENIWKDYPVLGIGVGQYKNAYRTKYCLPDSWDYKKRPEERHEHPHNNFMMILAEAGAVGSAAFLLYLGAFLWFAFRGWQRTGDAVYLALLIVLLGTQLQGIMDTNIKMTVVCKSYWFLIGLALQMISYGPCGRQAGCANETGKDE